jgi:hypothetical protein
MHGVTAVVSARRIGAHEMDGDGIDEIPPRAGHDQVLVERHGGDVLPRPRRPVTAQIGGGVALLAVGGVVPERTDGRLPGLPIRRWVGGDDRLDERRAAGCRHAPVRHRRLHVRLHLRCLDRVRQRGEAGPDSPDELPIRSHDRILAADDDLAAFVGWSASPS